MSTSVPPAVAGSSFPTSVEFFFDPGCPWTWLTSRWMVDAAGQRDVEVRWRSLSLGVLNAGREIPEAYRAPMAAGRAMHRIMAALRSEDRNDLIGELYTEYGNRVFCGGQPPSTELVDEAVATVGAQAWAAAAADAFWDGEVEASTKEAVGLAGPDVGSPVLAWGTPRVAYFGPIVSPSPSGADAARLLDVVLAAATVPGFFELKRGRTAGPQFGSPA